MDRRAEIIFWGCVAVMSLLLAFGKFFPLYAMFYKLPLVSSIRNPNKFLQVFQWVLGILAAYGLDGMLRWKRVERGASSVVYTPKRGRSTDDRRRTEDV